MAAASRSMAIGVSTSSTSMEADRGASPATHPTVWSRAGREMDNGSTSRPIAPGRLEVWKVPAAGGQAVQITRRGGFAAFESQDGKSLYYAKGIDVDGLWSVAVNGGEEAPVLDFPKASFWGYWALVEKGIYFVNTETGPQPALQFLSFAEQRVVHVAALDRRPVPFLAGIGSVSRRKMDSVYPGGSPQQRHHARGELSLNSAASRQRQPRQTSRFRSCSRRG